MKKLFLVLLFTAYIYPQSNILPLMSEDALVIPTEIPNLVLWIDYDASTAESSALTTNASNEITGITDISGNSVSLSIVANPIDSVTSIYFSGDDYFTLNSLAGTFSGADKPFTLVTVMKPTALAGNQTVWSIGRSSLAAPFTYIYTGSAPSYLMSRRDDASTADAFNYNNPLPTTADYVMWSTIYTGTTVSSYVGSSPLVVDDSLDLGVMTVDRMSIGALGRNTYSSFFVGHIKAVLLFSRAITLSELALIRKYYKF